MKKQLFFDLDRTLWDFEANSQKALDILYHELKLNDFTKHFVQFHQVYKNINANLWQQYGRNKISKEELRDTRFSKTLNYFGVDNPELAQKLNKGYIELSPNQTMLFPNTIETLTSLKNQGYSMSIISNGFSEVQFRKLENAKLTPFFDHVVCSEMVGYTKPDKRVFDYALQLTKTKASESIMIGDDIRADVLGSEAIGMTGILFDENEKNRYAHEIHRVKDLSEIPLLITKL